jgi:hypothetical protein
MPDFRGENPQKNFYLSGIPDLEALASLFDLQIHIYLHDRNSEVCSLPFGANLTREGPSHVHRPLLFTHCSDGVI